MSKKLNYFVHKSSFVDANVRIGEGTKIWYFSHIESGTSIGTNCNFGQNVYVGQNVKIGDSVKIQNNVSVYYGVELEDFVFCGPSVVFTNDLNPRAKYSKNQKLYLKTLVKEGASLGANSTIICGNTIGSNAFVGAGAIITKDVKNNAIVVGNPAKQIGWVCDCGVKLDKSLICSNCNRRYKLEDGLLFNLAG